jgi:hypothetical protein
VEAVPVSSFSVLGRGGIGLPGWKRVEWRKQSVGDSLSTSHPKIGRGRRTTMRTRRIREAT